MAFPRVAVKDVRVDGADIRAGDVVMCSLSGADRDDLIQHDPAVIAAVLHRDHARDRDDATVVVIRGGPG